MGKGQLLFKGDKPKKKKSKSKHSQKEDKPDQSTTTGSLQTPDPSKAKRASHSNDASAALPTVKKGTGKLTTSGTVVTGHDSKFEKELSAGDAILCVVEGKEEMRVITMRLSNVSLNLSSAFSQNLKIPTAFQFIRKPRDATKERREAQKRQAETEQDQKTHAFDLYDNNSLVYREKTEMGSYRIKNEQIGGTSNSRGDLLQMRAKRTSDKYC